MHKLDKSMEAILRPPFASPKRNRQVPLARPLQGSAPARPSGSTVELVRFESLSTAEEPTRELPEVLPPRAESSPAPAPSAPDEGPVVEPLPVPLVHPLPADLGYETSQLSSVAPEPARNVCQLDLSTASGIVSGQNPQVALAAQRYR